MTAAVANPGQITGELLHPIINDPLDKADPWSRNYGQPPPLGELLPRSITLRDARPLLSEPDYTPLKLLASHGFGIVKHESLTLKSLYKEDGELNENAIVDLYQPEIKELVKKTLGAKHVFITMSTFRRGTKAPEKFKIPDRFVTMREADKNGGKPEPKRADKWIPLSSVAVADPVRLPHLDFTPVSARRTVRLADDGISKAAAEAGIIAAEDEICQPYPFKATDKESDKIVAEEYNANGPGPRYAAYSIWRPLKRVERDPFVFSPRKEAPLCTDEEMTHWNYENKAHGPTGPETDWLKQFAMLGIRGKDNPADKEQSGKPIEWHYLSGQEPDEVTFLQLFDSASLGSKSEHMGAPFHASPEIGSVAGNAPRESLDIRVFVIW